MAGKFITFEGGEGAGKSTQIRLLGERLKEAGIAVTMTREPGGTPQAEAIRKLILSGKAKQLGPEGEAVLFAAARADHVDKVIRPALAEGRWVLCDRFSDSTRVYQAEIGGEMLDGLDRVAVGRTQPDRTYILDVPASVGLARMKARAEAIGSAPDRFEQDDAALHQARRRAFLEIVVDHPERCVAVDANRPEHIIADEIWADVSANLLGIADEKRST